MIDIHAHILPGVDDGSQAMNESLKMVKMAQDSKVTSIVATPHCNIPGSFKNYVSPELEKKLNGLRGAVKNAGINVNIIKGMEIFGTEETPQLLADKKLWTINDTRYFLIEFAFDENPDFCSFILEDCAQMRYIPVVAHPERYYFVQSNPQIIYDWYQMGYCMQINKGSVLGKFGRRANETAQLLLRHGLVSCMASDAHSYYQRTPHMQEARHYIAGNYGLDYAEMITRDNPGRILKGSPVKRLEPIPFNNAYFR